MKNKTHNFIKWLRKNQQNPFLIVPSLFAFSAIVTLISICWLDFENWEHALLFFAVFGGGLAVWGRVHTGIQLKATEKQITLTGRQIELSRRSDNNKTFLEATRMLHEKNIFSHIAGLHVLIKLARDDPKNEYIRCTEFVCAWLRDSYPARKSIPIPHEISFLLSRFFGQKFSEVDIITYMKKYNYRCWPNLLGVNFMSVYFKNANLQRAHFATSNLQMAIFWSANLSGACFWSTNLQEADFKNAILEDADLTNADMQRAKNLTAEQILSAKWYGDANETDLPKLPAKLEADSRVKEWLSKPHGNRPPGTNPPPQ